MLTAIVINAILSIHFVSVHSATVQNCLVGEHHKTFPSAEPTGFATCFPWQNKSCCTPETTVELKTNGITNLVHFDWGYCGGLSKKCREYFTNQACLYYCDPNLIKWEVSRQYISRLPVCSDTCDEWFEACKNDKTYSENWLDDYTLYHTLKGPIKTNRPCRTFDEIFKSGEGMCNSIFGPSFKYERSANCIVFDFKGENPNDKVVPVPSI